MNFHSLISCKALLLPAAIIQWAWVLFFQPRVTQEEMNQRGKFCCWMERKEEASKISYFRSPIHVPRSCPYQEKCLKPGFDKEEWGECKIRGRKQKSQMCTYTSFM